MSDAEVLSAEGGGAPLPPKRPTILSAAQDGCGQAPVRPAPARPAPPPPRIRPTPVVPKHLAASGPAPAPVPQRPVGPLSVSLSAKQSGCQAKSSSKSKSQGSVRKRPEITIVDARPMSQAGFRELKGCDPSPVCVKPQSAAHGKEGDPVQQQANNGGLQALPSYPLTASSETHHFIPPPSHSPPPIPSSKPGPSLTLPPLNPKNPVPTQDQQEMYNANHPMKVACPAIPRPARPKSAIIPCEQSIEKSNSSPPPLPKRSPIVCEAPAPSNVVSQNPPPKPARLSQADMDLQQVKGAEGGGQGQGQISPNKPVRVSIIRPPRRQTSMIDAALERKPQEGQSQHLSGSNLPVPASRPVCVVAAIPKDSSEAESLHLEVEDITITARPPVPVARPRGSPREPSPEEATTGISLAPCPRSMSQNTMAEHSTQSCPQTDKDETLAAPDRPRPPVPASRSHAAPPEALMAGGSPRLSQKMVPSKPPQPSISSPVPVPSGSPRDHGLTPPRVPSRSPAAVEAVPDAEGSLYAVSEPLDTTDTFPMLFHPPEIHPLEVKPPKPSPETQPPKVPPETQVPGPVPKIHPSRPPPEIQPSRPPPPVPKSRPKCATHTLPMSGRPLPSIPAQSSTGSLSSRPVNCYEDVESVKAQTLSSLKLTSMESQVHQENELARQGSVVVDDGQNEDDLSAMYARVNKPSKQVNTQGSQPDTDSSVRALSNPVHVSLKHITPEDSAEAEAPPVPPKLCSNNTETLHPPLTPKPKLSILVKPHIATKPKSPRKEEIPAGIPDALTKAEPAEQTKPPLVVKRPTIIRPPKAAPRSDNEATGSNTENAPDVQMRDRGSQNIHQSLSELSGNEDIKISATERPVPSRRPLTIIGLPHPKQKPPGPVLSEDKTFASPDPKECISDEKSSSGTGKSGMNGAASGGENNAHSPPWSSSVLSKPSPPRPGKPCKPDPLTSPPSGRNRPDPGSSASSRPPSPAPPRPATRPGSMIVNQDGGAGGATRPTPLRAAADEEEGGAAAGSPPLHVTSPPVTQRAPATSDGEKEGAAVTVFHAPAPAPSPSVKRWEPSPAEQDSVERRSRPTGAPPPRPMSMPPVKPPLSSAAMALSSAALGTEEPKLEKPSRPQPVRPAPPKHPPTTAPPPLPLRPGLSHPLYGYMAAQPHAIAVHTYSARHPDELSFQEGDTVVLLKHVDEQWLIGRVGEKDGIFPQTFVHIIHPLHNELPSSAIDEVIDSMFEDALQEKPDMLQGPRCRARFDFEGEGHGDLAFEDGDVIQLKARCGNDWLKGELNGKMGVFPAAFVEIIEDLPEETCRAMDAEEGQGEVTALFDFNGQEGELSFEAGDKISILGRVGEQWLLGESGGKRGSFPTTFVDVVPGDLPQQTPQAASEPSVSTPGPQPLQSSADARLQNKGEQWGQALYSFEKMQEGDLELKEGDHILILEHVGQEWLRGRLGDKEGVFPASFVHIDPGEKEEPEDHGTGLSTHTALVTGRALFEFKGQTDNELSFKVDDEIVLGSMVAEHSEWQWGELNGKKGMFPASFVEMI